MQGLVFRFWFLVLESSHLWYPRCGFDFWFLVFGFWFWYMVTTILSTFPFLDSGNWISVLATHHENCFSFLVFGFGFWVLRVAEFAFTILDSGNWILVLLLFTPRKASDSACPYQNLDHGFAIHRFWFSKRDRRPKVVDSGVLIFEFGIWNLEFDFPKSTPKIWI